MAYRAKYRYRWASQNGNQGEVLLLKDGYTGAVIDRPLGRAPELSMEQNGHIHGTSLVLYLECREDGEYSELYTSSAKDWQVQLWWNGRSLWTGYLTPELYSEPDIAPPYDVCVTATDGLGELKRSEYKPASWDLSLEEHLYGILALTGLDQTIYHTGGISADGRPGASMLHEVKVDLSHMQGQTCYDVLDGILTAINAEITMWGQQWMLLRPTDLDHESANLVLYPALGGGSQTWSIPSYGSARTHGRWPVGQMSTQIIAARSAVTVQSPNHLREGSELSPDGWSGSGSTATRVEAGATSASGELITEGHWELMAGGSISQSVKYSKGLGAHTLSIDQYGISKVQITYTTSSGSAVHRLGMANGQVGWDMGGDILIGSETRETLEIPIPAWAGAGTLTVSIAQYDNIVSPVTAVYGVSFAVNGVSYGLELRLDLSNGARSEADAVESAFSTYPGGEESYDVLLSQSGLPSFGGSPVSRWSTTKLGSQSYIGLLAMDIALGCALPRARKTGKLNVPQGADPTFLLLSDGSRNYFVNTYTVDLLEDEVSVDMVSLPAAELEVAEETYSAMTEGSSASYGSGSPGSQALPGYTVLSYDEAVALSEDPGDRTLPSAWALKTHISDGVKHITTAERTKWNKVVSDFAAITGNDADSVINKWEEVVAFLDTYTEADTLANLLSNKVDKVSGKGLSTNDFTDALLTKLNGIEEGANKYIHPTHSAVAIASANGRVLGNISVDSLGHVTSVGYKALGFADIPSLYIGKTKVQSSAIAQALTGISSITLEGSTAELKWDDDKSAWRLSGNLLVDGFVASGGTGSSGGSSGSVDVSYVANLTAGTLLGTLTINGTDYQILAPSLTASSINAALGNTPVARATADAEGNSISGTYAKTSSLPTKVSQLTNDSGYITGITKAMVEGVLTGNITSHTHSQYLTAHQSVSLASGTNNGTLKLTVGSTVTDNIAVKGLGSAAYTNSSAYAPASHTHTFASLTSKPTTISGYGITDAYTKTETDTKLSGYLPLTGGLTVHYINSESEISGDYLKAYAGLGDAWTGEISSMSYAAILGIGNPSRGFQLWTMRGNGTAGSLHYRVGTEDASAWNTERILVDNEIINLYAPSLSGKGASGTWGISISGSSKHIAPSSYTPSGSTVGEHKAALVNAIQQQGLGIGDNITVPGNVIRNWHNDSATVEPSSVYSMIKIGGGYAKNTYGQWLLSSYSNANPLIVGRTGGKWTEIETLAFITDNVASATKLRTSRTIWGQPFDGTANVSGALTGATTLTASGDITTSSKVKAASLTLNGTNLLEWDESNSAWKFNGNLIATGFIASGDISAQAAALAEEEDRIAALEAQVAELQAEIETLKAQ